jgi:PadR family transcriptional regulator, regulatory protein AphA
MWGMSLRHAILGLLVDRPASGYDLMKRFDLALARVWPAAQSQLYTELNQLADDKLIEVIATGARGRKLYALTDSGLAELRRWLVETEPRRERRNDELLRVFFLGVLNHQQAIGYLRKLEADASTNSAQLTALDASITWDDDSLSIYGRLAMEFGHRLHAMRRDWAQWAIEQLETQDRRPAPQPQADAHGT